MQNNVRDDCLYNMGNDVYAILCWVKNIYYMIGFIAAALILLFILLFVILTKEAKADSYIHINGWSKHFGECKIECNKHNYGLGFEFLDEDNRGFGIGGFNNSLSDNSYYAGYVSYHTFCISGVCSKVGYILGALSYPSERSNLWPLIFPVLNIGSDKISINLGYIPKLSDLTVPALFFNLRIKY